MARYYGDDEKRQFVSVNQPEISDSNYDRERGFEDRQQKPKTDSYDVYGGEPKNESYADAQSLSGGYAPGEEEAGYGSREKSSSQNVGNEDRVPQSFAKWEGEDRGRAAVEEEGGYESGEKRSSQYGGTEGGIPQSIGKWESEDTGRAAAGEEGGYGGNETPASHDSGHGDWPPQSVEQEDSEYKKHSPVDVPYAGADRLPSDSDLGSKPYSEFSEAGKPGGGYDNEDVSCGRTNLEGGGIGHVPVAEDQAYAKEEKSEGGYVPATEEPCGREERAIKQDEGYGANEASTYKSITQEDSKEGLKEKLQENLVPGDKKGGEEYGVDVSPKKEGLMARLKGKLKSKPHGDGESKNEEEACEDHLEEQEYHVGDEKEGHKKKGIFEKIKEKLSPSSP